MSWNDVLDQQRTVAALRRALASGRVAHAYLLHGPDGAGKRAVALAFAKALQCEQEGDAACDACPACAKVRRLTHPDVQVLMPQPSDAEPDDVAERLQRLAAHPYAAVDFVRRASLANPSASSNKQATYPVRRVNEELRRSVRYRPLEGRYQVVVLTDADLLRVEAANAFLKLLEEPGAQTVFLLTTSRPDRLLPTILSRCQRLRLDPLPPEVIERALVAREEVEPPRAATLARMADGSYTRALDLAGNEDLMEDRERVVRFVRLAYANRIDHLADLIEAVSAMGRERVKSLLRLLLNWLRDLVLYRATGARAGLVNVDQAEAVVRFCENVPGADLEAMIQCVEEAVELAERNVHLTLVLTALAQALRRAMHGRQTGGLYVPLGDVGAHARVEV